MGNNILISYKPKEEYNELGFHKTLTKNINNIKQNNFNLSNKENDWLGEGVYFWDNKENAIWWKVKGQNDVNTSILICDLKCPSEEFLNLDNKTKMKNFELFCNQYITKMKNMGVSIPTFSEKDKNKKKKFFCDLYCCENNFKILSFTFEHDRINLAGFKIGTICRRQICVRTTDYISIVSVI